MGNAGEMLCTTVPWGRRPPPTRPRRRAVSPLLLLEALTCREGDGAELHPVEVAPDPPVLHHGVAHRLVVLDVPCKGRAGGQPLPTRRLCFGERLMLTPSNCFATRRRGEERGGNRDGDLLWRSCHGVPGLLAGPALTWLRLPGAHRDGDAAVPCRGGLPQPRGSFCPRDAGGMPQRTSRCRGC